MLTLRDRLTLIAAGAEDPVPPSRRSAVPLGFATTHRAAFAAWRDFAEACADGGQAIPAPAALITPLP